MPNVIMFPSKRIEHHKKSDSCVGCDGVVAAADYFVITLSGDHRAVLCSSCHKETPSWVWMAK